MQFLRLHLIVNYRFVGVFLWDYVHMISVACDDQKGSSDALKDYELSDMGVEM